MSTIDPTGFVPLAAGPQLDPGLGPAEQFEGFLLQQMVRTLRQTVPEGMFGDLAGPFADLMDQELARSLAQSGQFGLQQRLMPELSDPVDGPAVGAEGVPGAGRPRFERPVDGARTSAFGGRRDPFSGARRRHQGVDLAGVRGTPVRPAAAGVVVASGESETYGNYIDVQHEGGWRSRYAHLDTRAVAAGDTVRPGQLLGTVGSTGRSTGPHLHFELSQHGVRVDPEDWLDP